MQVRLRSYFVGSSFSILIASCYDDLRVGSPHLVAAVDRTVCFLFLLVSEAVPSAQSHRKPYEASKRTFTCLLAFTKPLGCL